jgi:hypothetical protein
MKTKETLGLHSACLCQSVQQISSPHFLFMLLDIHLIVGTLFGLTKIQITFEFGFNPLIIHKVITFELRKISHELLVFRTFFVGAFRFVYCLVIPAKIKSSSSLVFIHWFFRKLWPLDLVKYHKLSVFRTFFVLTFRCSFYIWYMAWPTKIQIKFELVLVHWFFSKLWHSDLDKYQEMSFFALLQTPY